VKVLSVVGARPNFMKIAPIAAELSRAGIGHYLVHTGQHYDQNMSKLFFDQLGIPKPDIDLGVGSGTQVGQTAEIMRLIEPVLEREKPEMVIVVGDVTSTMAATITAVKMGIPVSHVESGLRSFDRTMPEEINRLLTDSIADYHFTTEESANANLLREGVAKERIFFVGNTMIDTLLKHLERANAESSILEQVGVPPQGYGVVTLHRPSNVDNPGGLSRLLEALSQIAGELPLIFPVHPRTRNRISEYGLDHLVSTAQSGGSRLVLTDPLGYLDFLKLMKESRLVLTDSGGIQEETTVLGVPCLTVRENTERPVTVEVGTNILVGCDPAALVASAAEVLAGAGKKGTTPPLWDGHAAQRIVSIIGDIISGKDKKG
jgi:UDP-N-acetylglucosamine 2-epimerase (non-hydrolysing)